MPGERNLATLLQNMKPEMHEMSSSSAAFRATRKFQPPSPRCTSSANARERPLMRHEEAESAGLSYQCASRLITLTVHSSLEAVGFLAAVTGRLAEAGISVNVLGGFYHDHLFVPEHRADEALRHLLSMSRQA